MAAPRGLCHRREPQNGRNPGDGLETDVRSKYSGDRSSPAVWKNLAVSWMYEPGSTFKPFVVAGALQRGLLNRDEEIDCGDGEVQIGGRTLHDTHPYGRLSVTDVLVKSSNIGMARIGSRLSKEQLYATILSFGFGRPTGSGLPGEIAGLLRPGKDWSSYSNASLSMGQELAVTPLQIISAHSALANGGVWIAPKIVRSTSRGAFGNMLCAELAGPDVGDGPATTLRISGTSVVSKATDGSTARWLIEQPMTEVVHRGTGTHAQIAGYRVFGKTGTAQKLDRATGTYSATKYVGSFLCGAPAADPQILVLVVVDEPTTNGTHYGGTVAAPAAAAILRRLSSTCRSRRTRSVSRSRTKQKGTIGVFKGTIGRLGRSANYAVVAASGASCSGIESFTSVARPTAFKARITHQVMSISHHW